MFDGIPISELRLIVHSIIFTILFIGLMVAVGFWAYTSLTLKNPKEKEHLRRLKEKAQSDELAKKQFEKLERRNKRRRRQEKKTSLQMFLFGAYLFVWVSLSWFGASSRDGQIIFGKIMLSTRVKSLFISK